MAREFEPGLDQKGRDEIHTSFGITEKRPRPVGSWVNRIVVYGDGNLRDRIVQLLMQHGIE